MASSSKVEQIPPKHQVFISFRGIQLRRGFLSFLVPALLREKVNVYIDETELRSRDLKHLFKRIEESTVAVVIFSNRYTESRWCLDELVKIKERMTEGKLEVIPIFYQVSVDNVKTLEGSFGTNFRKTKRKNRDELEEIRKWEGALKSIPQKFGLSSFKYSTEYDLLTAIVEEVKKVLNHITMEEAAAAEANNYRKLMEGFIHHIVPSLLLTMLIAPHFRKLCLSFAAFLLFLWLIGTFLESQEKQASTYKTKIGQVVKHWGEKVIKMSLDLVLKRWEKKSFMLYARQLYIVWSETSQYWTWCPLNESSDGMSTEVAKLNGVYWLEVIGGFQTKNLSPGTTYEVVFVMKLKESAFGWETPVTLKLQLPNNSSQTRMERTINFKELPRKKWVDIQVGEFVAPPMDAAGDIHFSMYQFDVSACKTGLIVKEVVGKFEMEKLTPNSLYEAVFVVKLIDSAKRWDFRVEIPAGEFTTSPEHLSGKIEFSMLEVKSGQWKSGLIVKGVAIRPKN
ncbi:Toll/interleukin-1 receptor homology (TIR) domain [Arabidopsis thaliana x Arabidopsis arenosa]|uniref:Toll/interleukin-1 receptor homology (TIR) domain n=1 Tax=Arabidopsis thaliana x Arabidopsis arenosa TaxID=1240361 RepID=A0A8T1Y4P1_9BRAS|nr:Toll/interleukin-1 receptor homology (TIR) domain [Arabidopsis thaliana x Arabidopsis arenosa]